MPKVGLKAEFRGVDFGGRLRIAGTSTKTILGRAVRRTAERTKTEMVRALVGQTGLKRKVIYKALRLKTGELQATIASTGGNIRLKFFAPRETRKGVSAKPWGKRSVFAGTFMKAGRFPNRVPITKRLTGHNVYIRKGRSKWPVMQARSGLFIPTEMVRGASAAAFNATTKSEMPKRIQHELKRVLGA